MRIGEISSVDREEYMVRVYFAETETVSDWMSCLENAWPLEIGDTVLVVENDIGVCVGKIKGGWNGCEK